jgi:excisionase family DNA binding protein
MPEKKQPVEEKFVMTTEASRLLNRSASAVLGYVRAGRLPAIRAGNGHRLFRESDVRKLAEELNR